MADAESSPADTSLEGAYALETPEDSIKFYREWASTYDSGFAQETGYVYAANVAAALREELGSQTPVVLDIGAGTGLVAQELPGLTVDGLDISQEMLNVAGSKGLYRNRICADLTDQLDIADASYGAFTSAGTFTHGHVGPVCLPELMRIAQPGALFVLGINAAVFDQAGFGSAFANLVANGQITPIRFRQVVCFAKPDHAHGDTKILLAVFRRS